METLQILTLHSYLFILLRNNGGFGVLATGVQQGGTVTSGTIVVGCHFRGRPGCAGELGDSSESSMIYERRETWDCCVLFLSTVPSFCVVLCAWMESACVL